MDHLIKDISAKKAKKYIKKNHYSHGCHNGPSPCYGLYDEFELVGVLVFACPCSENVRASIFGKEHKDRVTELHRLHTKDKTPKNTESWFVSRCLKFLHKDKPEIRAVVSFADSTEGHKGIIYRATNAMFYGMSSKATFYEDSDGRLRHPRQNGENISKEEALEQGWKPVKRKAKYRYLWLIGDKRQKRKWREKIKVDIQQYPDDD